MPRLTFICRSRGGSHRHVARTASAHGRETAVVQHRPRARSPIACRSTTGCRDSRQGEAAEREADGPASAMRAGSRKRCPSGRPSADLRNHGHPFVYAERRNRTSDASPLLGLAAERRPLPLWACSTAGGVDILRPVRLRGSDPHARQRVPRRALFRKQGNYIAGRLR
jgi:hypothetical protein